MAVPRQRSRVEINPRLNRLLRRLPEDCTDELKREVREAAELVHYEALKRVPVDTGALAQALRMRIGSRGLSAEIGYSKRRWKRAWDMAGWRARFIEYGTKGYFPGDTRRTAGSKTTKKIKRYIPPRPARPFLRPAYQAALLVIRPRLARALIKALDKAGRGV